MKTPKKFKKMQKKTRCDDNGHSHRKNNAKNVTIKFLFFRKTI